MLGYMIKSYDLDNSVILQDLISSPFYLRNLNPYMKRLTSLQHYPLFQPYILNNIKASFILFKTLYIFMYVKLKLKHG